MAFHPAGGDVVFRGGDGRLPLPVAALLCLELFVDGPGLREPVPEVAAAHGHHLRDERPGRCLVVQVALDGRQLL